MNRKIDYYIAKESAGKLYVGEANVSLQPEDVVVSRVISDSDIDPTGSCKANNWSLRLFWVHENSRAIWDASECGFAIVFPEPVFIRTMNAVVALNRDEIGYCQVALLVSKEAEIYACSREGMQYVIAFTGDNAVSKSDIIE